MIVHGFVICEPVSSQFSVILVPEATIMFAGKTFLWLHCKLIHPLHRLVTKQTNKKAPYHQHSSMYLLSLCFCFPPPHRNCVYVQKDMVGFTAWSSVREPEQGKLSIFSQILLARTHVSKKSPFSRERIFLTCVFVSVVTHIQSLHS